MEIGRLGPCGSGAAARGPGGPPTLTTLPGRTISVVLDVDLGMNFKCSFNGKPNVFCARKEMKTW